MAPQRKRQRPDDYFVDWKEREALAESMIPIVGALAREQNVKCYIYGKSLVNLSVLDIMKAHRWVRQVEDNELSEFETIRILEAMAKLNLGPSPMIGRIARVVPICGIKIFHMLERIPFRLTLCS